MEELTAADVRRAMRNASRSERERMTLPDLGAVPWAEQEFLGWRDPKLSQRGYLVQVWDSGPVGVMLRAPETPVRRKAQCALCHVVHDGGVALFSARRAGEAGRRDNTVGTYICVDLRCSRHLRESLEPTRDLPDPSELVAERSAQLSVRTETFLNSVLKTSGTS